MLKDSFSGSPVRRARRAGTWSAGVNRSVTLGVATGRVSERARSGC